MPATRACTGGVLRRNGQEQAAHPDHFVLQLPPEFRPALIEDRLIETGLLFHSPARLFYRASSRPGHIAYLQVFNDDHRVVLADGRRDLVEVIPTGVGNANMDALDLGLSLLPVVAELLFAAHGLLCLAQISSVSLVDVEWWNDGSIRESGKADHAHIDAYGIALGNRLLYLALRLYRDEPFAVAIADSNVLDRAKNVPAVAIAQPAELWQEDPAVGLIQLEPLRETETVSEPTLFETRIVGPLLEEVGECAIQILERVLQGLRGRISEPSKLAFPCGKQVCHFHVANELVPRFVVGCLQRQCLVEHEPARPSKTAHLALLFADWHEFVLEGLKP